MLRIDNASRTTSPNKAVHLGRETIVILCTVERP
ncbi:hypothetical protein MT49_3374 [Mycobacterium tuberculosis 49-02]|nr:hypothetical protein MT49_3374 [Mycobacterium tuberculosis 49-02]